MEYGARQNRRHRNGSRARWIASCAVVSPIVIVLADVAHLHLKSCGRARHISDGAALEDLDQDVGVELIGDFDLAQYGSEIG